MHHNGVMRMKRHRGIVAWFAISGVLLFVGGCAVFQSAAPQARLTASTIVGVAPLTVDFDASMSTDPDDDIAYVRWSLESEDVVFSTELTPSHTFSDPGVYNVGLTVVDRTGQTSMATRQIVVTQTSQSLSSPLTLIDWDLIRLESAPPTILVEGRAINLSDDELPYGAVSVDFYDDNGSHISSGVDIAFDLAPNEIWTFVVRFDPPQVAGVPLVGSTRVFVSAPIAENP